MYGAEKCGGRFHDYLEVASSRGLFPVSCNQNSNSKTHEEMEVQ